MTSFWYPIQAYISFWFKSKNQHGIHSPFVFDFVTKCLYNKKNLFQYENLANYRSDLLRNSKKISVTDLGSGSRLLKQKERSIASIAKHSGASTKKCKLLFKVVNYFKPKTILELGTSLGIGTFAMHLGNPNSQFTTIEGCPNISKFTKSTFEAHNLKGIQLINDNFKSAINTKNTQSFDLIYFDGNHQKEATIQYFESLLSTKHNNSVWIFDDIYWSKSMTEAWETIKTRPEVSITIDTFHLGFVFFRKEQAKEHFKIRV